MSNEQRNPSYFSVLSSFSAALLDGFFEHPVVMRPSQKATSVRRDLGMQTFSQPAREAM